jgi:hypothetical protein
MMVTMRVVAVEDATAVTFEGSTTYVWELIQKVAKDLGIFGCYRNTREKLKGFYGLSDETAWCFFNRLMEASEENQLEADMPASDLEGIAANPVTWIDRLVQERERKGVRISQEFIATKIGVSPAELSRCERHDGNKVLTLDQLRKYEATLETVRKIYNL